MELKFLPFLLGAVAMSITEVVTAFSCRRHETLYPAPPWSTIEQDAGRQSRHVPFWYFVDHFHREQSRSV